MLKTKIPQEIWEEIVTAAREKSILYPEKDIAIRKWLTDLKLKSEKGSSLMGGYSILLADKWKKELETI